MARNLLSQCEAEPPTNPIATQTALDVVCAIEHPRCLMCGSTSISGLGLRFRVESDGSVSADFRAGEHFQSYPDRLHGGITAALLDAAMTNALFAIGVVAVTAELKVRFLEPVAMNHDLAVRGRIEDSVSHPLYYLCSEILQGGKIVARGSGKFLVKKPD